LFFAGLIIPAAQDKRHHGDEDTQQDLCTHGYSPVEGAFQSVAAERANEVPIAASLIVWCIRQVIATENENGSESP